MTDVNIYKKSKEKKRSDLHAKHFIKTKPEHNLNLINKLILLNDHSSDYQC